MNSLFIFSEKLENFHFKKYCNFLNCTYKVFERFQRLDEEKQNKLSISTLLHSPTRKSLVRFRRHSGPEFFDRTSDDNQIETDRGTLEDNAQSDGHEVASYVNSKKRYTKYDNSFDSSNNYGNDKERETQHEKVECINKVTFSFDGSLSGPRTQRSASHCTVDTNNVMKYEAETLNGRKSLNGAIDDTFDDIC